MKCPLCDKEMELQQYEGVEIDVCNACGGVWLDGDELGKIIKTEIETFTPEKIKEAIRESVKEKSSRSELMRYLMSFKKDVSLEEMNPDELLEVFKERWGSERVVKCPKCGGDMEEFDYAGTGIMLDRCPQGHGFWLDTGELQKSQIMMEFHKKMTSTAKPPEGTKFSQRKCPLCEVVLIEKEYEGVSVDICDCCGGVWLDKGELHEIIERREKTFTEQEQSEVNPKDVQQAKPGDTVAEINCPVCGVTMKRFVYACTSGIVIDRCPNDHGVWLDSGELEKIQIYVEKSEDIGEKEYAKYSRILNEVKADCEARREASIQRLTVSRFGPVNRMMRWIARKWY